MEPRGGVHDIACSHSFTLVRARAERDEHLTGGDADADLEPPFLHDRVADPKRRANRALGIILVDDRRAEQGHRRVADELLDGASEPFELPAELRVVRREHRANLFGIESLCP